MCLAVYLGVKVKLQPEKKNERGPSIFIKELAPEDAPVRDKFFNQNVYYLGSRESCGCGFSLEGIRPHSKAYVEKRKNYLEFVAFIKERKLKGPLEIFICWEGDQKECSNSEQKVSLTSLESGTVSFEEKTKYLVDL